MYACNLPSNKVTFNNFINFNDGTIAPINRDTNKQVTPLGFREMEELEQIRPDLPYTSLNLHRDRHLPVMKHFTIHNLLNYIVSVWWIQPNSQKYHLINQINNQQSLTIKVLVGHQILIKTLEGYLIKNLIINNIDSEL